MSQPPVERVRQLLYDAVINRLAIMQVRHRQVKPEEKPYSDFMAVVEFLGTIQTEIHWWRFQGIDDYINFWDEIVRPNTMVTSFILDLTVQTRLYSGCSLGGDEGTWQALTRYVGHAFGGLQGKLPEYRTLDDDLAQRMTDAQTLTTILHHNHYLVIVLLLATMPELYRDVLTTLENAS